MSKFASAELKSAKIDWGGLLDEAWGEETEGEWDSEERGGKRISSSLRWSCGTVSGMEASFPAVSPSRDTSSCTNTETTTEKGSLEAYSRLSDFSPSLFSQTSTPLRETDSHSRITLNGQAELHNVRVCRPSDHRALSSRQVAVVITKCVIPPQCRVPSFGGNQYSVSVSSSPHIHNVPHCSAQSNTAANALSKGQARKRFDCGDLKEKANENAVSAMTILCLPPTIHCKSAQQISGGTDSTSYGSPLLFPESTTPLLTQPHSPCRSNTMVDAANNHCGSQDTQGVDRSACELVVQNEGSGLTLSLGTPISQKFSPNDDSSESPLLFPSNSSSKCVTNIPTHSSEGYKCKSAEKHIVSLEEIPHPHSLTSSLLDCRGTKCLQHTGGVCQFSTPPCMTATPTTNCSRSSSPSPSDPELISSAYSQSSTLLLSSLTTPTLDSTHCATLTTPTFSFNQRTSLVGPTPNLFATPLTTPTFSFNQRTSLVGPTPNLFATPLSSVLLSSNQTAPFTIPLTSDQSLTTPINLTHSTTLTTPLSSNHSTTVTTPLSSNHSTTVTTPLSSNRSTPLTTPLSSNHSTTVTTPLSSNHSTPLTTPLSSNHSTPLTTPLSSTMLTTPFTSTQTTPTMLPSSDTVHPPPLTDNSSDNNVSSEGRDLTPPSQVGVMIEKGRRLVLTPHNPPHNSSLNLSHKISLTGCKGKCDREKEDSWSPRKLKGRLGEASFQRVKRRQPVKRRRSSNMGRGKKLEQLCLDLGQRSLGHVTCRVCGMVYTSGLEGDVREHRKFHCRYLTGVTFNGWKNERVVSQSFDGRILMVLPTDCKQHLKKIQDLCHVVDAELGYAEGVKPWNSASKIFLYVSTGRKVMGCVIAEKIEQGYPVISASSVTKCSNHLDDLSAWFCSSEAEPAQVGINRMWVSRQHRRRGVASRLLDAVRIHFHAGMVLSERDLAFSDPTPEGKALAAHYCSTDHFLVYHWTNCHHV